MIKLLSLPIVLSLPLFFYPSSTLSKEIPQPSHQIETAHKDPEFDTFDAITFADEDNDPLFNEFFDTVGTNSITRQITPAEIMQLLVSINAIEILEQEFYLHTNPLNKRNPLDEPIFEPDLANPPGKFVIGANFWVRKKDRSNFTKNSTKLSSYLSLVESDFIDSLENSIALLANLLNDTGIDANIDIRRIFFLFENMTVQERQAGFMWHLMKKWKRTTLRIMTPLYYLERNFSLTPLEQDAVAAEFGESDPKEEEAFRKAHFISDKIGMGDTRLEVDCKVVKSPDFSVRLGGQATIPTAFTWGKGFVGSSFPRTSTLPIFDFETLFDLAENPTQENAQQAFKLLGDFLLDSFDRLAANLLETQLGNNRHLGIGIFMRGKTSLRTFVNTVWAERVAFTNRISLEFFLPSTESRFYINNINQELFDERDFSDPAQAPQNLIFLQEQLVERLFLRAFDTRIRPGVIFRWTSSTRYQARRFGINAGTDFWLQSTEHRGHLYATPTTVAQLNLPIAKPPMAWQSKLFGGVILRHKTYKRTWFISLNGDATFDNRGIGQDWAISFNFEASF